MKTKLQMARDLKGRFAPSKQPISTKRKVTKEKTMTISAKVLSNGYYIPVVAPRRSAVDAAAVALATKTGSTPGQVFEPVPSTHKFGSSTTKKKITPSTMLTVYPTCCALTIWNSFQVGSYARNSIEEEMDYQIAAAHRGGYGGIIATVNDAQLVSRVKGSPDTVGQILEKGGFKLVFKTRNPNHGEDTITYTFIKGLSTDFQIGEVEE